MFEDDVLDRSGAAEVALYRADAARDARKFRQAADLYKGYLQSRPNDAAIHIQCAHMLKEAGEFDDAELHYEHARRLTPEDPDLALQLGHFYKITGRPAEAERAYSRAAVLAPAWPEPAYWLGALYQSGWRNRVGDSVQKDDLPIPDAAPGRRISSPDNPPENWATLVDRGLLPELAPRPRESFLLAHNEEIQIRWLGRRERTRWGFRSTLRGADCIRGFCISASPIVELRASLNGLRFCIMQLKAYPLKYESRDPRKKKYVFSIWYDFSNFQDGVYELELQFIDKGAGIRSHRDQVVIAAPLSEAEYPDSDRLVSASATDTKSLEELINSRPSMIRLARRARFATRPRNVLVLRVDQLGDMVISIPAFRRLRELLPDARLVGLLSAANADLARSLKLFDEIIVIDFPDDDWERRRVMPLDRQDELRRRLAFYKFDIAIDMSESDVSRSLLGLSGAPFRLGYWHGRSDFLASTYESHTSDPINDMDEFPISTKTLGLIEWLGAILSNHARIITRKDLTRDRLTLEPYRLSPKDRFAVLHTGARLKFSQWPHYDGLAATILDRTDLKVVMITDDPKRRASLPQRLLGSDRFRLLDRRLPFDDFDALLSFCTVFVGNDSGPAHLASLRGANVVNVFLARHNWNEWGHENNGYIITRRVPCSGCNIDREPEECGKDFACITHIAPDEVFDTVVKFV